jgi:hypothetical protein
MSITYAAKQAPADTGHRLQDDRVGRAIDLHNSQRTPRRQHLVRHLHRAGARPVLEAMLEVSTGRDLDQVLERYGKIPLEVYRALGASMLPIDAVSIINGGRA